MKEYNAIKCSSKGGRDYNQDYCDFMKFDDGITLVLADGLGGHSGGEVASKVAVETVLDSLPQKLSSTNLVLELMQSAQESVILGQKQNANISDMRTTLVVCIIKDEKAFIGHIGDSRLYIFRGDEIIFQTKDHSLVQLYVNLGEVEEKDLRTHPDKNILRRVIGDEEKFNPEIAEQPIDVKSDDVIMLCTDGFWESIEEEMMIEMKSKAVTKELWLNDMIKHIKKVSKKGHDNYSAVLMQVK